MKTLQQIIIDAYGQEHYEEVKDYIDQRKGFCSAQHTKAEEYHQTKGVTRWLGREGHFWKPIALTSELLHNNGWLDTRELVMPSCAIDNPQWLEVFDSETGSVDLMQCYNLSTYLFVKNRYKLFKIYKLSPPPFYLP